MSTANRRCIQQAYQADGSTSSDVERWYVDVPAVDYMRQAFFGAISNLGLETSYDPISEQAAEYGSLLVESLTQIIPPEVVTVPADSAFTIIPADMSIGSGNAYLWQTQANQYLGGFWAQNAPTLNQRALTNRYMSKGSWRYSIWAVKSAVDARLQVYGQDVDGTQFLSDTIDLYNVSTLINQNLTGTFTVVKSGLAQIEFRTPSKGAAGTTTYRTPITACTMWRIGD